jgi:hypothetical protein
VKAERHHPSGRLSLLLPPVETVDELADEQLPGVALHLTSVLARIAARMAAGIRREEPVDDDLLDVDETAKLTRRSTSWLHHHGHELPGFRQSHGKGGRKFWSRRALMAWISNGEDAC